MTDQKAVCLSVCLSVCVLTMQGVPSHNRYTQRLVILHRDTDMHLGQFADISPDISL